MYLIVGLGNPGKQYEDSRHNVGFLAIDELASRHQINVKKIKGKAIIGEGMINNKRIVLAKPQTYMNLSGEAVFNLINYYKVPHENLFVLYDDIDLDVGALRIRKQGSSGTHNGMRNIIYLLGYDDFPRFRIGVSKPQQGRDLASFVLSKFTKSELPDIINSIKRCTEAVEYAIVHSLDTAMNTFNTSTTVCHREKRD